ncbi:alpha-L-fucosidase [Cohnella sp. 56]|uniref:alpha-L-fucosidase n=1 Tax=Cohnella sp. 56 TaxID=3113722 RepID=UPI0030E78FC5
MNRKEEANAPGPAIPLPTARQLEWADAEIGVIIHYDIQVFEPGYEWRAQWGYTPSTQLFQPEDLDTDQWIEAAKSAGATYAVLVAKHCSGFSLWPTEAHDYSVRSTPWRDGQGDIVGDFVQSCRKYGLRPGLYYSVSANAHYRVDNPGLVKNGSEAEQQAYNEAVIRQVTELWTRYGPLFEIWFDGGTLPVEAGGPDVAGALRRLQPDAVCFQGPLGFPSLVRWSGNEDGSAPDPCWSRADYERRVTENGLAPSSGGGNPEGEVWAPAEADLPNRREQWFWYEGEDHLLIPVDELVERYYTSVGRNANLMIGMVIDRRGRVPDADAAQFAAFGEAVRRKFAHALGETEGRGYELTLELEQAPATLVNQVTVMEQLAEGERIRAYRIEGLAAGGVWMPLCEGRSIGHKRIERFEAVSLSAIRLIVDEAVDTPVIRKLIAYHAE